MVRQHGRLLHREVRHAHRGEKLRTVNPPHFPLLSPRGRGRSNPLPPGGN
jgi:hypothetical protein